MVAATVTVQNAGIDRRRTNTGTTMNATAKAWVDLLGAAGIADAGPKTDADLVRLVREGLPVAAVDALIASTELSLTEIGHLVLPRQALGKRRRLGGRLTMEQSDRLLRVARLMQTAIDTFGRRDKALAWLRRPTTALDGESPLARLDTDEGARQVEALLGRIAHGIAA